VLLKDIISMYKKEWKILYEN